MGEEWSHYGVETRKKRDLIRLARGNGPRKKAATEVAAWEPRGVWR